MADDAPRKAQPATEDFDVVVLRGQTEDGQGTRVVRARPSGLEAGEVRPLRDGQPLVSGEVVRLERRADAPELYDVRVQHVVKARQESTNSGQDLNGDRAGPAQVATEAYRESWDRTFGDRRLLN